ncbi:hypothetical protein BKA00_005848 [Actinomadura coerulea]|uniref:Uncharacterized protein n=1 Tax=Actinomadura coerulea TaxID=46159 RepID=A0A7X0G3T8_9ACTN|nr:hypothetical protein [Actinomadura coerulea]MBB6398934.1 hypothetical protein [Actinomadura coerulea]
MIPKIKIVASLSPSWTGPGTSWTRAATHSTAPDTNWTGFGTSWT